MTRWSELMIEGDANFCGCVSSRFTVCERRRKCCTGWPEIEGGGKLLKKGVRQKKRREVGLNGGRKINDGFS